jgi:predicted GTPase
MAPDSLQSLLEAIEGAVAQLGDEALRARVSAVARLAGSARMRLLIVGSPGSGRSLIANLLLGQPDLLPASPLPKRPIPIGVSSSESASLTMTLRSGLRVAQPVERLRGLLLGTVPGAEDVAQLDLGADAGLLDTVEVRIETLDRQREDEAWHELLAATDYTLFVLRATALLSAAEADFVDRALLPAAASSRLTVLINQIDRISEGERAELEERVQRLFQFSAHAPVIALSAAEAIRSLQGGAQPADGAADLLRLIQEQLVERSAQLKTRSITTEVSGCLAALRESAARRIRLAAESEAESRAVIEKLDTEDAWLRGRVERAEQRVDLYVRTLAHERLLAEIERFSQAFKDELPQQLAQVREIALLRRYLPGYLDTVWAEFFEARLTSIRAALAEELEQIARQVAADLREFAEEHGLQPIELAATFDAAPGSVRSFWQPRRSESGAASVATNMQFAGLLLLVVPGLQVLGAASIGLGQVLRMTSRSAEREAQRTAMLNAVIETWPAIERQIARRVEAQFATLAETLRGTVRTMHEQALEAPRSALATATQQRTELATGSDALTLLLNETIPALEQRLQALLPGQTAKEL